MKKAVKTANGGKLPRQPSLTAKKDAVIDAAHDVDNLPWNLVLKSLPQHHTAIVALGDALAALKPVAAEIERQKESGAK